MMRKFAMLLCALLLTTTTLPAHATSQAQMPAAASSIVVDSPLLVVGAFVPGGTLRAIYPKQNAALTPSFQWLANGANISGATSETFVLTNAQIGKTVSARLTLSKTGATNKVVTLSGLMVVNAPLPTSNGSMTYYGETMTSPGCVSPHVTGEATTPTVGWPIWLPCDPWNNSGGGPATFEYDWYRNGTLVSTSQDNRYRLTGQDAGQSIWGEFKATWANGLVFVESKRLADVVPSQLKTATPTISGNFKLSSKLTAKTSGWDSAATLSYQWFRDCAPIDGATTSTYVVTQADLGKAIQVLVSGQRTGFTSASAVSAVVGNSASAGDATRAYSAINQAVPNPLLTGFDISFLGSPTVTSDSMIREQALVQRAASFWSSDYSPSQVTVVYITKDDSAWATNLVSQHPGWSNHIPGGINSWINSNNCGFALAFKDDSDHQVFIQCVRNGADSTLADRQVGPHEYTHWVQYAQNSNLLVSAVPWLIEGQANFYGLALGIASVEPSLKTVNVSLAGQATQYDIYNGYSFASFKILDILKTGNYADNSILLKRSGTVWDQYLMGSLISEWLVANYGSVKYASWMKALLHNLGSTYAEQVANNAVAFRAVFGFDYDKLGLYAAPYLAARSDQLRAAWANR